MKKKIISVVIVASICMMQLVAIPTDVAGENEGQITITNFNVSIRPEFFNPNGWDNNIPSLFVRYDTTFSNKSDQPYEGNLKIPVPTDLPEFISTYIAEFKKDKNKHVEVNYEINEEDNYFILTPSEPIPANGNFHFVLEFFGAPIEGDVERTFNYQFNADRDIENLNLYFFAPLYVDDFQIIEEPTDVINPFPNPIEVHVFEYGDEVKQGDVLDFGVTYTKDNVVTTIEAIDNMRVPDDDIHAGLTGNDGNETEESEPLLSTEDTMLIILALIIVAAFVLIRSKKLKTTVQKEKSIMPKRIVNKEEEIKKLRKMLAYGQIEEKTYKEKRAKLE